MASWKPGQVGLSSRQSFQSHFLAHFDFMRGIRKQSRLKRGQIFAHGNGEQDISIGIGVTIVGVFHGILEFMHQTENRLGLEFTEKMRSNSELRFSFFKGHPFINVDPSIFQEDFKQSGVLAVDDFDRGFKGSFLYQRDRRNGGKCT